MKEPESYLHYWDEDLKRFTTYEEERTWNFAGIVFPQNRLMQPYPGGHKYWIRCPWSDALEWVKKRWRDLHETEA